MSPTSRGHGVAHIDIRTQGFPDRRVGEAPKERVLGGREQLMDVARPMRIAAAGTQHTRPAPRVPLDRLDDLEQRDALRCTGEAIAPTTPQ